MRRAESDCDVFLSEVCQPRNKLSDLHEVVSTERLTTILLDSLPAEKYSTIKIPAVIRDPDSSLREIESIIKKTLINHSERSSVEKYELRVVP